MITFTIFGTEGKRMFLHQTCTTPLNMYTGRFSTLIWKPILMDIDDLIRAGLYVTSFEAESREEAITIFKILEEQ